MQRTFSYSKISSILQCQKISRGIHIRLENHLLPQLETAKTPSYSTENLSKTKNNEKENF